MIKRWIIRWAIRQVKKEIKASDSFEKLSWYGIADIGKSAWGENYYFFD